MKLFEVDLGSARDVLAVLQGMADKDRQSSEIPFKSVINLLRPFGLGISTPDALIGLKNQVDPQCDVIKDILDDGTVVLNTKTASQVKPEPVEKGPSPTLDKMASRAAKKLTPDI